MALQDEQLEEAIGQRVVLRELTRADVDLMAEWPRFVEPELQWANLELSTPRERDAWFDRSRSNSTRRRYTIWTDDGRAIGTIGLRNLDFRFGEGTLGIIVNAADVGRGYGTDAVRTLVGHAFRRLGLRKVYLDVAEGNDRARRSYEKVGFVRIGQHRGADGLIYVDMLMTRDRWQMLSRRAEPSP
ncbi:MAG TPA: GNAT family N-acetyltransferase [Chloroflexota bacterium]|nr:GNAT family N-acetyltransferase [Chloroflexota bacterium]